MYIIESKNSTKVISKGTDTYTLSELHLPGIPNSSVELGKADKIKVVLEDQELEVTAEWLFCYAKLGIHFPKQYKTAIKDLILFIPNNPNDSHNANVTPKAYFKHPIEFTMLLGFNGQTDTFRLIPYAPNYAITKYGMIFNVNLNRIYTTAIFSNRNTYVRVELNKQIFMHHILVASAWCENKNPRKNIVVDHINGVRNDNRADNLRWVTQQENVNYSINAGRSGQSKPCVVKNLTTGEEQTYVSLTAATKDMGRGVINPKNVNLAIGKPYIIRHNGMWYQLQYDGPNLEWITVEEAMLVHNRIYRDRYILTIQDIKDPEKIYMYNNLRDISEFINNGIKYISLQEAIKYLDSLKKYTIKKQELKDVNKVFYIAYNTVTKEVIYSESTTPLVIQTGVAKSSIRKSAFYNGKYMFNNWVFKIDNGDDFTPAETPTNKAVKVKVTNNTTGKLVGIYDSLREAGRELSLSLSMIRYYVSKNSPFGEYRFETIVEDE